MLGAVSIALITAAVGLGAIARHEPAFYRDRVGPADVMISAT